MPRPSSNNSGNYPSRRQHKPSGLGVITLNGTDVYLGSWPAKQKRPPADVQLAYDRTIAEWLANGRRLPTQAEEPLTINELILAFWKHAEMHYRHADGTPTGELDGQRLSLRPLRELYRETPVVDFSPLKLKAVRQRIIDAGLCRRLINQRIGRIVRMFKWGVSEEMAPETVHRALASFPGLQKGRRQAREHRLDTQLAAEAVAPVVVALAAVAGFAVEKAVNYFGPLIPKRIWGASLSIINGVGTRKHEIEVNRVEVSAGRRRLGGGGGHFGDGAQGRLPAAAAA